MGRPVRIKSVYKPLYTSKKRYFVITGGRGSGKSFAVYDYLVRLTYEKNHGILFTRYTMTSAEKTIIPQFVKTISELGVSADFHITREKIINKHTRSFVFFSGIKTSSGDQTANLKSLPDIDTWVVEEGEDYKDMDSFIDIDDSIRGTHNQNRIIWIQNPDVPDENIVYQRFFKDFEKTISISALGHSFYLTSTSHPMVEHIHTTYHDNRDNLDPDKLKQWDKVLEKDYAFYLWKYMGGWLENKEGQLFSKSEIQRFKLPELNIQNVEGKVAFIDVADRGTDALSMPIGFIVGDEVYIVDWYFSKDNQDITIPEISAKCLEWGIEYLVVETNGLGLNYFEKLQENVGCVCIPFSQQANKHSRIIQNSGFIRNYFVFRDDYNSDSMYDKAMREFFAYNKDDKKNRQSKFNDDAPDSATGLWISANDLFGDGRWF